MGVIKKSAINEQYTDSIEDVLENIQNIENNQEPEIRRPRKVKQRTAKPLAIGGLPNAGGKSGKKKKRIDNSNFLLSLCDPEETIELSIQDFIPTSISVFTKFFVCRDSFEIWNEFINSTGDNENWFRQNLKADESKALIVPSSDGRTEHPAFTALECFHKIDSDLRRLLRKRHIPLGTLIHAEQELITFFVNRPQSIYHCQIPNSFERLMIHAVSQYLDLSSLSYDRCGARWTRVRNKKREFCLPPVLLSSFLEKRSSYAIRRSPPASLFYSGEFKIKMGLGPKYGNFASYEIVVMFQKALFL